MALFFVTPDNFLLDKNLELKKPNKRKKEKKIIKEKERENKLHNNWARQRQ